MSIKSKTSLPFNVKTNSAVTGGYADQLHSEFYQETEITNNHEDDVIHDENGNLVATLQSPFTERWVGGRSYRHVSLNTGSHTSESRPEGWHVDLQPQEIRIYSNAYRNSPPAYWTREERTKRPINIKNIGNQGLYIGNYNRNYDFLQTSARRITNNLIVDGYVAGGVLTTQYVTGANEYTLPQLDSVTGSKSIFVERFNAPGSKEESSRGALDREGEEMSPNIPLSFRNHYVRRDFYNQLSQSTPQFGGTIHQVNRNRLVRGGKEYFDNGFVTHAIPRTDIQYSWITASSNTTAAQLGGYQSFRRSDSTEFVYNKNEAYTDIDFISGSLVLNDSQEYFVDNSHLRSLVKDKKSVNLDTNTFSIESPGTSASFSEITNMGHSHTTWTSLRVGDSILSRQMRKNNILSILNSAKQIETEAGPVIPKRGDSSTNYIDPVVTFKYKPLRHVVSLGAEDATENTLVHDYANQMSTFANKDLLTKLNKEDQTPQFYDLLREQIRVPEESSIFYKSHSYNEIVWPKEENAGLDETRKRKAYYLDQPGFTRDGYDIQLGTQRAFWRDSQTDRKRSNLSDGGYYSSFNQLSTQETGSDFHQNEDGALFNNEILNFNFSFVQSSNNNKGLFNSISVLEKMSDEREIFVYSGSIKSTKIKEISLENVVYNSINKKGYVYDISGEFNSFYLDFYEQVFNTGEQQKKSIGTLYRNTSYKSLLTDLPDNRDSYTELAVENEDEQIFANNKVKYLSFIGGGELNNSSFIQNVNNFTNTTGSLEALIDGEILCFALSGSDIYVGGTFTSIAGIEMNCVAKWDGTTWSSLGAGLTGGNVYDLLLSGSDIYAAGSFTSPGSRIAKWNGSSWSSVDSTTFSNRIRTLALSGSDIYAGGDFTSPASRIAKWNGSTWSSLGASTFNSGIYDILLSGSDIYAGGFFTTPYNYVAKWDGTNWSKPGTNNPGSSVKNMLLSGSHIYIAQNSGNTSVLAYGSWFSVNTSGEENNHMILSGSDIYFIGGTGDDLIYKAEVQTSPSFEWTLTSIDGNLFDNNSNTLLLSGSDIYAGGKFLEPSSRISRWDGQEWNKLYIGNKDYDVFSLNYYSQSFNQSDFIFSTMDNGLVRTTEQYSNKNPFFDSYNDYAEEIRGKAKDYSVVSEFNISEHMSFYDSKGYNFRHMNSAYLSLDGISGSYRSANSEVIGKYKKEFMSGYVDSDIFKKKDKIEEENRDISKIDSVNIKLKGIKKLLPYNGFYPQDRTVQLANLYSDYIEENLNGGTYNLSYRNDYFNNVIAEASETGGAAKISSIHAIQHNNKYLMAAGSGVNEGVVDIFTSSVGDSTDWDNTPVASISYPSVSSNANYGQKIYLVSASNGVNLISYVQVTASVITPLNGYLTLCTSSNYTDWTTPQALEVYDSSPSTYISGSDSSDFGLYYDLLLDTSSGQEKIHIAIGSPTEDNASTNNGAVYYVSGTLVEQQWRWSEKVKLYEGDSQDLAGNGVSILSCSSGYQIIFAEELADNPDTNLGNLLVVTSSNGTDWSNAIIIASGSSDSSRMGQNDVKAIDFEGKTHVFFSEYGADIEGKTNNGAVYTITSSTGNQWPDTTSYLNKKLIYYRNIENDQALSNNESYSISLFSGSDGRLYYGLANQANTSVDIDGFPSYDGTQYIIGYKYGDTYSDYQNEAYFLYNDSDPDNGMRTSAVLEYNVNGYSLPMFLTDVRTSDSPITIGIRAIRNNIFTEFKISTEGKEKYFKQAAIEPIMGPGILYNTIKSGIAVDWPCVTGSNTAIQPYGDNTIVNAYYPKSIKMAEYDGDVVYESTYGLLRDRIDYRAPFESLIFPEQIFVEKEDVQDITTRTILSTIGDDDPVTLAIKDAYVYGGYEPYISPIDFSDIDNLGPKKFSIPFVYRKKNASPNTLYSLAMSNFLAESVKFFLKGEQNEGKMVSFVSKEDDQWGVFESGKTYYMDVILEKSKDLVMMEAWHSDKHPTGSNDEKMNGRYFGYPVNKTDKDIWGSEDFTLEEGRLIHNDPAYAPYTPPYYEGKAIARISFTPPNGSRAYTFDEVVAAATVENIFNGVSLGASTGSNAYLNAMPVGSSVNLFGSKRGTILDSDGLETQNLNVKQWVISPKMETPVLDFSSSQELVSYQNDYSKTSGFGRGMWSGYGQVPENGKEINLKIDFPFPSADTSTTGSLVEKVFQVRRPSEKVKSIGRMADQKVISEAVVVIPYLERRSNDIPTTTMNKIYGDKFYNFIRISDSVFSEAKNQVDNNAVEEETSITKMISSMKKYVIPPNMNFLQYDDIKPFVMYVFEVEHTLDQQDLVDIWQGLMPKISYTAEEIFDKDDNEGITIEHQMGEKEFFHGRDIPEDIKWMVFKVKRKAEADYANVTEDSSDDKKFLKRLTLGRQEGEYSYNWPYDYFSLVELAKVEVDLTYKKKE